MTKKWRKQVKKMFRWLQAPAEMRMTLTDDKAIEEVLYARHTLGFEDNEEYFRALVVNMSQVVREMENHGGMLCVRYPDGTFKALPLPKNLWDQWIRRSG